MFDPEIPVNIYEIGLVYDSTSTAPRNVSSDDADRTSPARGQTIDRRRTAPREVPGGQRREGCGRLGSARTRIEMSETAKLALGMY